MVSFLASGSLTGDLAYGAGPQRGPIPRSCRVENLEDPEVGLEDPEPLIRGDLSEANLCCQSRATVGAG